MFNFVKMLLGTNLRALNHIRKEAPSNSNRLILATAMACRGIVYAGAFAHALSTYSQETVLRIYALNLRTFRSVILLKSGS